MDSKSCCYLTTAWSHSSRASWIIRPCYPIKFTPNPQPREPVSGLFAPHRPALITNPLTPGSNIDSRLPQSGLQPRNREVTRRHA